MSAATRLHTWWKALAHRSTLESEMEAELRFHIESYAADLVRNGLKPEEAMRLVQHMNERLHLYYEASKIFNALVMAGLLAIFYRRQKWYFGEHAVTSFYFLSFTLLLTIVKWPLWLALGAPVQSASAYILSLIFLLIALPYLWVTLRQLHGEGPWKTAAKSVLVYGGTQLTIIVTTLVSFGLAVLHTVLVR